MWPCDGALDLDASPGDRDKVRLYLDMSSYGNPKVRYDADRGRYYILDPPEGRDEQGAKQPRLLATPARRRIGKEA